VTEYVKKCTWHRSQEIVEHENGGLDPSLTVNHLLELKRWILSWGADAKLLEPEGFVRDIKNTVGATYAQY
jgi:proteasome accessory factor B